MEYTTEDGQRFLFKINPREVYLADTHTKQEAFFQTDNHGDILVIVKKMCFRIIYNFKNDGDRTKEVIERIERVYGYSPFSKDTHLDSILIIETTDGVCVFDNFELIQTIPNVFALHKGIVSLKGKYYIVFATASTLMIWSVQKGRMIFTKPINIGPLHLVQLTNSVIVFVQNLSQFQCWRLHPSGRVVACVMEPLTAPRYNYIALLRTENDEKASYHFFVGLLKGGFSEKDKVVEIYRFSDSSIVKLPSETLRRPSSGVDIAEWRNGEELRGIKIGDEAFYIERTQVKRRKPFTYISPEEYPEVCPVCLEESSEKMRFVVPFCGNVQHAVCEQCWVSMGSMEGGRRCPMCRGV